MTTVRSRSRSTGAAAGLTAILIAFACTTPACSDDSGDPPGTGGTGGKGATGGAPGTGGRATGGSGGATGGRGSGGTPGSGGDGKATGGSTGGTEGGPPDAGCQPPLKLVYPQPGCSAAPICGGPTFDACAMDVCACDGTTLGGCGDYTKPWRHQGPCNDGGPGDGGDASTDASSS